MCLNAETVLDQNGQRVYSDFASGEWLEETEVGFRTALHTV